MWMCRNADVVLDYLLTHPGFLESFVIGPQISSETFQRWVLKRNNKLRRDSRRQLLSGFSVKVPLTPRENSYFSRHLLAERISAKCCPKMGQIIIDFFMNWHWPVPKWPKLNNSNWLCRPSLAKFPILRGFIYFLLIPKRMRTLSIRCIHPPRILAVAMILHCRLAHLD